MAAIETYLLKINQPVSFGPGIWFTLHLLALDANTYAKKMAFIHIVELIFNSLPCETCRQDALGYLQKHPLTEYWGLMRQEEDIGMFYWTVDCHNWVNRKLNKLEVSRDQAYQFYKNPNSFVCTEECGKEDKVIPLLPEEIKKLPENKGRRLLSGFVPL